MKMFNTKTGDDASWISMSDLMAGLMMVFLFIVVIYARDIDKKTQTVSEIVSGWQDTESEIYEALLNEFRTDLGAWKAEIERESLTIRFLDQDMKFAVGDAALSDQFKSLLDDFIPRYVNLLASKFADDIDEVRIEGHTSSEWLQSENELESFIRNMELSQKRTRSVLEYALHCAEAREFQPWMLKKMSAHGLSSARLIFTNGLENKERSRRVEFTIKTRTQEALFEVLETIKPLSEE